MASLTTKTHASLDEMMPRLLFVLILMYFDRQNVFLT
jgi:hypothetical protein